MVNHTVFELLEQHFSFWKHLSAEQKELLCHNTTTKHYPKGTNLFNPDTDCTGLILVKSGQLRTYLLSDEGREVTLYRLFANDICILSASCVLDAITFDVFVDAQEDTEVILISGTVFHPIAEKNIYAKCFAYELAAARFSDVMWAMQQILFMGVDKRLAVFLWDEISKQNTLEIKMTQDEIARCIGSAREVVSRMLKYFSSEGIVQLSRGSIQIPDKKKLQSFLQNH